MTRPGNSWRIIPETSAENLQIQIAQDSIRASVNGLNF